MSHKLTRRTIRSLCVAAVALPALAAGTSAQAGGVSGPAFYVDHELYRTVATPTDLSGTGAPAQSWDTIYSFGAVQRSVATAAPGDPGYNGGRWQVHAVSLTSTYAAALAAGDRDGNGVLDAADEVQAAIGAGALVDGGVVKYFVCTVNPVPHGRA
ncbi:hypothetical protein ASE25_02695 [Terrabacter sp. Root85]|uniref:hypothetical protein n=1 Tax=unclassified Terrabacter TaxID=2630222 RepID=UPI0006F6F669|nr:hypothetical protein [Terrabacter sp. Root85]KRC92281.1 hypothetical protein ASE25_02695 [Terrabacter sp. Root85]